jgi:hypothetical protein
MSVKLNRPPNIKESQKDSNFNGKTIPYPGFEPGTYGLAVSSHNHCTIWVGHIWYTNFQLLFNSENGSPFSIQQVPKTKLKYIKKAGFQGSLMLIHQFFGIFTM